MSIGRASAGHFAHHSAFPVVIGRCNAAVTFQVAGTHFRQTASDVAEDNANDDRHGVGTNAQIIFSNLRTLETSNGEKWRMDERSTHDRYHC